MINVSRWMVVAGRSVRVSSRNPLTMPAETATLGSMSLFASQSPSIGLYAIWQCNHCTERRVWGNVGPERDRHTALLRCQESGQVELHTFVTMSRHWVGQPTPLPLFATGGLPCRRPSGRCACGTLDKPIIKEQSE